MLRNVHCLLFTCVLTSTLCADDARQVFDSLYGAKVRQVAATIDRADDIALAGDMLAVATTSGDTPGLQALLCEAVYDLGAKHPDGFAAAAEAMRLLAETQPDRRDAARLKLIDLLSKQSRIGKPDERDAAGDALIELLTTIGHEKAEKKDYTAAASDYRRAYILARQRKADSADALQTKLQWATARDRTTKQLARLQEKLLRDANDHATAEEIVKLYVVEFDDPLSAVPFLNRVKDEQLKLMVPLATKSVDQIDKDKCLKLGEWYKRVAKESGGPAKAPMLQRAKHYVEHFLGQHSTDDLTRKKAVVLLDQLETALRPLTEPVVRRNVDNRTVDVLKVIDVAKHAHRANWRTWRGGVLCEKVATSASLVLPVIPAGDYELRLTFSRQEGADAVIIILPVGQSQVALMFDGANVFSGIAGLDHLNGTDRHSNVTTSRIQIQNGKKYSTLVTVKTNGGDASVAVIFGGKELFQWDGSQSALSVKDLHRIPDQRAIGIQAWQSAVAFHEIKLTMLSGEWKLARDPSP